MKAFKLTPEQKRWGLTLCLVATVGFNLSHLVDQPTAGQSEFASTGDGSAPETQAQKAASSERKEGYVAVDGKSVKAQFIKLNDRQVLVNLDDPNMKLYEGAQCPDGRCNMVQFDASFEDPALSALASIRIQQIKDKKDSKSSSKSAEETDLSSIPADKMTDDQKDKRADELLAKIEDSCGPKQKAEQLRCYAEKLKSLLSNAENKKIISDSKVSDFVNDNIKDRLSAYLQTDHADAEIIERLHKALPGKYKDARSAIVEGSRKAIAAKADSVRTMRGDVRTLQAQKDLLAKDIMNKNSYCYRDTYSMQDCSGRMSEIDQEIGKLMRDSEMTYNNLRQNLLLVKNENLLGLNEASSRYNLEDEFKRQLINRLDSLKRDLYTITDATTTQDGSVPVRGRNRGTGQASSTNGVQRFTLGQRINLNGTGNGPGTRSLPNTSGTSQFPTTVIPGSTTGSTGNGLPSAPALRTF